MSDEMEEVIQEFLVESYENLDQYDQDLVALEESPEATAILGSIFRTVHTIKGTCGFLGYSRLEKVAHTGENLLSELRDGRRTMTPAIADALLAMGDAIRAMLGQISATQAEGEEDYGWLIETFQRLQAESEGLVEDAADEAPADAPPADEAGREPDAPETAAPAATGAPATPPAPTRPAEPAAAAPIVPSSPRSSADATIRVDVHLLDKLMNLVGELVLARNQILQYGHEAADPGFSATTQRLNVLTTELQEGVMKTRMQPIGSLWSKYPRVVRDLSKQLRKQVRLEMEGKDTELDKSLLEAIKDPLTHLVRNAVDHGLEIPAKRRATGKAEEGTLSLRAYHEGGLVNIEIADDGAGIDPAVMGEKAVEKGLVDAAAVARMGERELVNLVFLPGFSTAGQVSNISGRGVGMDVVRTNIEKIGGTVEIHSGRGTGTTFRIKIPLTLAIIPAQVVMCAGQRFAIPQVSLLELLRLDGSQASKAIERIHGTPVYRLRGDLLPLVHLDQELGLRPAGGLAEGQGVNIVVLQTADKQFGLVVDGIGDTEEIVVKPLGEELKALDLYAGATIMGDGTVALILDVPGIAARAHVAGDVAERAMAAAADSAAERARRQAVLLFGLGEKGRLAMPLSMVARLEEFEAERIEPAGARQVVQYRGELLPLIPVCEALGGYAARERAPGDPVQVVVHTAANGRSVGLVVDDILDIVEQPLEILCTSERLGLLGSAVVQGRVTDLIDAEGIVLSYDPAFYEASTTGEVA